MCSACVSFVCCMYSLHLVSSVYMSSVFLVFSVSAVFLILMKFCVFPW